MQNRNWGSLKVSNTNLKSHLLNSSWLCTKAWATRSNLRDLAVRGLAPPELSPGKTECNSSLDRSVDMGVNCNWKYKEMGRLFKLMGKKKLDTEKGSDAWDPCTKLTKAQDNELWFSNLSQKSAKNITKAKESFSVI